MPHNSAMIHLQDLVNKALCFSRNDQARPAQIICMSINQHVEFMKATLFFQENLLDMIIATIRLANKCTPFVSKDNIRAIIRHLAELIADIVFRSAGDITHVTLASLEDVIENVLRIPSRDNVLEEVLITRPKDEEDVAEIIRRLDDYLLDLQTSRA
jgi:hypothetical protein